MRKYWWFSRPSTNYVRQQTWPLCSKVPLSDLAPPPHQLIVLYARLCGYLSLLKRIDKFPNSIFGEAPSSRFRVWPSKKILRGSVQFDFKPEPKPLEALHTFQSTPISPLYQAASNAKKWGVFFGVVASAPLCVIVLCLFFPPPAVKARPHARQSRQQKFIISIYVCTYNTEKQSWLNSRIITCDGDGVSFSLSVSVSQYEKKD